ncbi:MAG: serine/threonine-protein phosphatase 6 regulatory ankyrin repeat subunit A-like [Gammaproteobacteria bacterium]|jgi:ankyrin repeat protein|nr:serine/threonine-protein phosphatase 6 regulatory ankyrin repeat subunit A-like [Gammaproteobacteria bacterium]
MLFSPLPNNNLNASKFADCFTTVMRFLKPKEIAWLHQVSRHWKEMSKKGEQPYWKQQCLFLGLNSQVLVIAENHFKTRVPLYYKNLYKAFKHLPPKERHRVHEPWELYCLSGQPDLIFEKITAASNDMGASALHYTALSGSLDALKCVLKIKELDPLARDNVGRTLLHYAAWGGSIKVLDYVVTLKGIDRSAKNYRHSLLDYAAQSGSLDMLYHVLCLDMSYFSRVRNIIKNNKSLLEKNAEILLCSIVISGSINILNQLLRESPDCLFRETSDNKTLFHDAALSSSVDMLNRLFEELDKLVPNAQLYRSDPGRQEKVIAFRNFPLKKDIDDKNILHYAAFSGSIAVFERTLKIRKIHLRKDTLNNSVLDFEEIDPLERTSSGQTILHCAAASGSIAIFEHILKIPGIDPLAPTSSGTTILHYAARSGSIALFEHVLKIEGIDPFARDNDGKTLLHHAAHSGSALVFKRALRIPGVNPLTKDRFGHTVLHSAIDGHSLEVLKCVLEIEGLDLSATDYKGKNVFHYAALSGSVECVLYLYTHRHKFNFDFALSIQHIINGIYFLSDDMKKILFLIKDDIRQIDSKKADFYSKVFFLACATLPLIFSIVTLILLPTSWLGFCMIVISNLIGTAMLGNAQAIMDIDNRSRFAWFFRPPSNSFEQYNYRCRFFSPPAVAAEQNPDQSVALTLG